MKKVWCKRIAIIVSLVMIGATIGSDSAYAVDRFEGSCYKLGRGLTNIITSPLEAGYNIDNEINTGGIYKGVPYGLIKGIVKMVQRMSIGVYEVLTFPIEKPENYRSLLEPEFVFVPQSPIQ